MTHAYNKDYLSDAMRNLGEMMNYAVHDCDIDLEECFKMFLISGDAYQFGRANPHYIAGMSGVELAMDIFCKCGRPELALTEPGFYPDRSPEYWCGWILAYYQWNTGRSFEAISRDLTMKELLSLYNPLHEASEERAVDALESRIDARWRKMTQLQRLRKYMNLTQAQLAERSGVSLRSIQMYEQRQKDINKAQIMTVIRLSQVLGCDVVDLLEVRTDD